MNENKKGEWGFRVYGKINTSGNSQSLKNKLRNRFKELLESEDVEIIDAEVYFHGKK